MPRIPWGADEIELSEAGAGLEPIELLDQSEPTAATSEVVAGDGGARAVAIGLAFVAVLGAAVLVLSSNPEEAPPTTTEPAPLDEEPNNEEFRRQTGEALIGSGPQITWDRLIWTINTDDFRWMNGAFVGDDGLTEWRIRPGIVGPSIDQRPSVLESWPDHFVVDSQGGRALAPRVDQPDHLLFFGPETTGEPIRVDLPVNEPVTDLAVRRVRVEVAVIGETAVAVITTADALDPDALGARIGLDLTDRQPSVTVFDDRIEVQVADESAEIGSDTITVPFEEVDFTITELSAMRPRVEQVEVVTIDLPTATIRPSGIVPNRSASVGVAGDRFTLEWANDDRVQQVSTSLDGRRWQPSEPTVGVTSIGGDDTSLVGIEDATWDVGRSDDGGLTWQYTPPPFPKHEIVAAGDVLLARELTMGQDGQDPNDRYEINLGDYELALTAGGPSFELIDSATQSVLSAGRIGGPASGVTLDPFDRGLHVTDPGGGDTLSVTESQLRLAYATTGEPLEAAPQVATAAWDGNNPPEWRVEPIEELFGEAALRVKVVGGDGYLLAIVSTEYGFDFYLADVS